MLGYLISFLLVATSSLFISISFENKKILKFLLYFLITIFAQVVLIFELLSLVSSVSEPGIYILNTVFLVLSFLFWKKQGKPYPNFEIKSALKKICNALLADKYLLVLGGAFIFMVSVSFWLISFMPVVNSDAEAYHVVRSLFWISQKNLNHFNFSDIRALVMPINSEILYAWFFIFIKKQLWLGAVSFMGFLMTILSLGGILTNMGVSTRRKLWVIFLVSSFPSFIASVSGNETDIIISGLVLASIYLYWESFKSDKKIPLFFSALGYALAIGTKSTAVILIPAVGIVILWLSYKYKGKKFYKPLLKFLGFGAINFIIFASYNYILNFIDYGNFAGSKAALSSHLNAFGIRALPVNFTKYIFMFFDFTGFRWNETVGQYIIQFRDLIISKIGFAEVIDGEFSILNFLPNRSLLDALIGPGILGFIVFLPCWIISLFKPLFFNKKQIYYTWIFGIFLVVAIGVMSVQIDYMIYSIRFLTCFMVIASPVLLISYCKKNNIYKFLVTLFALFYLIFGTTNLWARNANRIMKYMKNGATISQIREISHCSGLSKKDIDLKNYKILNEACVIRDKIRTMDNKNKILLFVDEGESVLFIKQLEFEGYTIDFGLLENIENTDLSKYDFLITVNDEHTSTNLIKYDATKENFRYKTRDIACIYLKPRTKADGNQAYKSFCSISPNYFKQNGFELSEKMIFNPHTIENQPDKVYNLYKKSSIR